MATTELLSVPAARAGALQEIAGRLLAARQVVLTTHVNADGDGAGCEAAVAAWLETRSVRATIVNPTPFPELYRFLLHRPEVVADWGSEAAEAAVRSADLFLVLDTSEANRLPGLADHLPRERTLVIDHHPPGPATVAGSGVQDPTASATGELIYDLLSLVGDPWPESAVVGVYVALVTDTGSFRYSNTSPRTHLIAAELLARSVDSEAIYRRLYATFPLHRIELLREALGALETDPDAPITWISVSDALIRRTGATAEDMEGIIEYARAIEGTEVALLFRELPDGQTKISFRSNGETDVNHIARQLGGGGHVKAAGATVPQPPAEAIPQVLAAVREQLRGKGQDERGK